MERHRRVRPTDAATRGQFTRTDRADGRAATRGEAGRRCGVARCARTGRRRSRLRDRGYPIDDLIDDSRQAWHFFEYAMAMIEILLELPGQVVEILGMASDPTGAPTEHAEGRIEEIARSPTIRPGARCPARGRR